MININHFLNKIKTAQAAHSKTVVLTLPEATGLHADITALLLELQKKTVTKPETIMLRGEDF